jgi:hypothetical protein
MNKTPKLMAAVGLCALAGAAFAQYSAPNAGAAANGQLSTDVNGSTTMPAEIVLPTVNTSGTSSTTIVTVSPPTAVVYGYDMRIPTRQEVASDARTMVHAGVQATGESPNYPQQVQRAMGTLPPYAQ